MTKLCLRASGASGSLSDENDSSSDIFWQTKKAGMPENCHWTEVGRLHLYIYIYTSGGPLSALTCCVNARLLSAIKKISPLIYSQSWVGSWVYTTQAMMTFTLIF